MKQHSTGHLVDSLRKPLDISGRDTSDRDPSILGSVDTMLLGQSLHLLRLQSSVGKHANLARDVAPVVLAAQLLEILLEKGAHLDDAVGHTLDLAEPLLLEFGVVEDLRGDAGAVDGRIGVERADEDLNLGVYALLFLGRFADDGESTNALTIETLS